jgi:hypothetical protein
VWTKSSICTTGFVVPPFGEAHNHNVEGPWNIDAVVRRYLEDGVFYVKIPGNNRRVYRPNSIPHQFAEKCVRDLFHGGLTATAGHPAPLYEEVLSGSRYAPVLGPIEKGWFNNRGYFFIDGKHDL